MTHETYRLSIQALNDLDELESYLSEQSPRAAILVLEQLLDTFELLAENPTIGESRDDLIPGVRIFVPARPAHNYVVFFHALSKGIEVNHVIHASRDWEHLLSPLDD